MSCRRTLPSRLAFSLAAAVHAGVVGGCEREPERPKTPQPELIHRFPLPTSGAHPLGIAAGPDGAMWFTERNGNRIGRIEVTPPHAISEYPLPTPGSGPYAIAAAPDGKLWFTEFPGDRIGRIDPRSPGVIFELMIPTSEARARAITTGPDGNVWFAEQVWRIGRVVPKPTPTIDDFALPRYGTYANGIVAGADGHLWYAADKGVVGRVLAVLPESILELQLRTKKGDSSVIAVGSDRNIWVVHGQTGTIARMRLAPPHAVTELRLPGAAAEPKDLHASPGYLWLSLADRTSIVRIEVTPPHRIREIPIPEALGPPERIAMGPDGNIWFTAPAGNSIGRLDVRALESRGAEEKGATSAPAVQVAEYEAGPAPVPHGALVIQTDANCTVSIDGVEMFRLARGQGRVVDLRVGTHLVTAVSATGPERWERSVEVFSGRHASADIELRPESRGVRPESAEKFVPANPRMEFVSIPAGEFVMGSDSGFKDERPPHRVRLTRSFQMGKYEVMQEEWAAVMGPIEFDESQPQWVSTRPQMRYLDQHPKNPVVGVSWEDAQEFLAKLDTLDNRHVHRLPTEAEWEYACRAGTTFDLPPNIEEMAWLQGMELSVQKVGRKKPNPWGLHDMHGNADEWVADWYDKDYYRRTPPVDPPGPTSGQTRVIRGGDMWNAASDARCANRRRGGSHPGSRSGMLGFRVVRRAR